MHVSREEHDKVACRQPKFKYIIEQTDKNMGGKVETAEHRNLPGDYKKKKTILGDNVRTMEIDNDKMKNHYNETINIMMQVK